MYNIGIISSSGGSVLFETIDFMKILGLSFIVATDRECDIEKKCNNNNIKCKRFKYTSKKEFSLNVYNFFKKNNVEKYILLYYTRFISRDLFDNYEIYNFHPSLLPLFPGLNSLDAQLANQVPLLGATLHKVDETCDNGKILGQIASSYQPANICKISFLQKVFLTVFLLDQIAIDICDQKSLKLNSYLNTNLSLSPEGNSFMCEIQKKHKIRVLSSL